MRMHPKITMEYVLLIVALVLIGCADNTDNQDKADLIMVGFCLLTIVLIIAIINESTP